MRFARKWGSVLALTRGGIVVASLVASGWTAAADDALYRDLGGADGVAQIVEGMVDRAYADPRIQKKFDGINPKALKESLRNQFCVVSGGGCKYEGETMRNAHADLALTKADFNALVEDLQLSMDAQKVPFTVQNRLLARLAPMHRDIITR